MKQEELLRQARARFREAADAEREIREEARKDLRFVAGEQWPERVRREREIASRPALTINRLPTFVGQIVNQMRRNKPSIKVAPVDSGTDPDTARVMQGLIRHIEYDSDAQVAYQTAFEYAATCGFGAFRILTDYVSDDSFDQEIRIEAIADPFSVYFDPLAKRPDRSDARYCFVVERISREEYKERWPNSEASATDFYGGELAHAEGWITDDTVQVAEYWYIETRKRRLVVLSNGEIVFADEVDLGVLEQMGVTVMHEREVRARSVRCIKTNGVEVLEEYDWPGRWIPIVPVLGKELYVEGRRKLLSLVRFARDPQQLYNFYKTAQAEAVMLAPKAPYIGAEGQFEGHEEQWRTANLVNYAYLEYKPLTVNGQPVGPPQRNNYEPPIQALSVGALQAADDIKATTGIFDPSLGAQSNETSGRAILARQEQANTSNFHFDDNLQRAQRHAGRILLDLIPRIYDTPRWVRIIGEDEAQRVVQVNALYRDEDGKVRRYDLGAGKYDVTVTTGPSFATRRQEAFAALTELARAYPQLLQIAGDIVFRNSDVPGADELAARLKKTLPPELAEEDKPGAKDIPPEVAGQMKALAEQNQQLAAELNRLTDLLASKRLELESRERIEALRVQADLIKTEAQLSSREGIELLRQEIAAIHRRLAELNGPREAPEESGREPGQERAA
jgi:hypothetical protein